MSCVEISVKINPLSNELISQFLIEEIGCGGVVSEEISYDDGKISNEIKDIVKGYLDKSNFSYEDITFKIENHKAKMLECGFTQEQLGSWDVSFEVIEDSDWENKWKEFWHVNKLGEKIVIVPSWEKYEPKKGEIVITLDPGSAFGTGSHPTTRLCIQALEKYTKGIGFLADVGTGSGILAIAAAKLGVYNTVGVDNDKTVIEVAKENAKLNDVYQYTNFFEGSANKILGKFKLVVANILAHILIDIMPDLAKITDKGGTLLLSGILENQKKEVLKSAIDNGFKLNESLRENNWILLALTKD